MIETVCADLVERYPGTFFITVHAAIFTTEEHLPKVEEAFYRVVAGNAYASYLLQRDKPRPQGTTVTVKQVCQAYLDYCEDHNKPNTYRLRADVLFDFCSGYPARYRAQSGPRNPADKIHGGMGDMRADEITGLDVEQWLRAHPGWNGTKRTAIQAVRRAFNYAVGSLITANPITIKCPVARKRVTYFTDAEERGLLSAANDAFSLALRVCIRTGARPDSEFAKLEGRHVEEDPRGQLWRFPQEEHKTGHSTKQDRVVFVPPEIADLVRELKRRYGEGRLFRNSKGDPWTYPALKSQFDRTRKRAEKKGCRIHKETCLYTCRHTFAKRTLEGYWGKAVTLVVLAALMGNSRQVCWDHYAKWCPTYQAPLWDAVTPPKSHGHDTLVAGSFAQESAESTEQ